jgi:hypothetical protein
MALQHEPKTWLIKTKKQMIIQKGFWSVFAQHRANVGEGFHLGFSEYQLYRAPTRQ